MLLRKKLVLGSYFGQAVIGVSPILLRLYFGMSPIGDSWQVRLCFVFMLLHMMVISANANLLLLCCYFDFDRRYTAAKMLSRLVTSPGIPVEEFLQNLDEKEDDTHPTTDTIFLDHACKKEEDSEHSTMIANKNIYFDLRDPDNAYAWLLTRRALRKVGNVYFERCQLFIGFYLGAAVICVIVINIELWFGDNHYIFGVVQLGVLALWITSGFVLGANRASQLQSLVGDDRFVLKREGCLIEKEIIDVHTEIAQLEEQLEDQEQEQESSRIHSPDKGLLTPKDLQAFVNTLTRESNLLRASDKFIKYEEQQHDPIQILGLQADGTIVSSVVGFIGTAFALAFEGLSNRNGGYDSNGMFEVDDSGN
jgi:hypothetical protein